jgi:hypothetical protein
VCAAEQEAADMHDHLRLHEPASERRKGWLAALKCFLGFSAIVAMMSAALYVGVGERLPKFMNVAPSDKPIAP